jgi:hypothetical protein
MTTTDSVFQRALSNMLTEIFDGPPGQEAFRQSLCRLVMRKEERALPKVATEHSPSPR